MEEILQVLMRDNYIFIDCLKSFCVIEQISQILFFN